MRTPTGVLRPGRLLLCALLLSCGFAAHAQEPPGVAFVNRLNAIVERHRADPGALCSTVIGALVDVASLRVTAAAGARERMTPDLKQRYDRAFETRLRQECVSRIAPLFVAPLAYGGERAVTGKGLLVSAAASAGPDVGRQVLWSLGAATAGARATDVLIDGRSAALLAAGDTRAILERHHGDLEALVQSLERGR